MYVCILSLDAHDLLSMLAVFSVVISISGSVKYSDATHLPFSGPEREESEQSEKERMKKDEWVIGLKLFRSQTVRKYLHMEIKCKYTHTKTEVKKTQRKGRQRGQV